jgi:hypothetical protein
MCYIKYFQILAQIIVIFEFFSEISFNLAHQISLMGQIEQILKIGDKKDLS